MSNECKTIHEFDFNLICEYFSSVENVIDSSLSDFEKKVLNRYVQGESYVKIAERLDAPVKSVDNAIQRIRKKTAKNIQAESNI